MPVFAVRSDIDNRNVDFLNPLKGMCIFVSPRWHIGDIRLI